MIAPADRDNCGNATTRCSSKKFLCPKKRRWTKVPKPKISKKPYQTRFSSGTDIEKIQSLTTKAMVAASAAAASIAPALALTQAAVAANIASMAAFPLEPAANTAINVAKMAWKQVEKLTEKSKQITFDLAHEALMFERGRIASCAMPLDGNVSRRKMFTDMHKYGKKLTERPSFIRLNDTKRGPGHKKHPMD